MYGVPMSTKAQFMQPVAIRPSIQSSFDSEPVRAGMMVSGQSVEAPAAPAPLMEEDMMMVSMPVEEPMSLGGLLKHPYVRIGAAFAVGILAYKRYFQS